jgi:hypothetical protein
MILILSVMVVGAILGTVYHKSTQKEFFKKLDYMIENN